MSSRERGHGWTDDYLRSVTVIGEVSVNFNSVSLGTSAASLSPPPPVRFIVNAVLSRNP